MRRPRHQAGAEQKRDEALGNVTTNRTRGARCKAEFGVVVKNKFVRFLNFGVGQVGRLSDAFLFRLFPTGFYSEMMSEHLYPFRKG
jgi:hypothetical protein